MRTATSQCEQRSSGAAHGEALIILEARLGRLDRHLAQRRLLLHGRIRIRCHAYRLGWRHLLFYLAGRGLVRVAEVGERVQCVAERLLGPYHVDRVKEVLGCLVPPELHPFWDGKKLRGKAPADFGQVGFFCGPERGGLTSLRSRSCWMVVF